MNALKTSLKIQDCLLPSLDLNRAMVRMLKGKLLVITQLHLAFSYSYIIYLEGINGNVLDLLQTFQFFQFCPQSICSRAWLKISILFINTFFVCCRLYSCAHSTTETAHFMSSPRWNSNGVINETAICEALTRMSQCEEQTACKEMAKGIWYTTASVSRIYSVWKVNKK